MANISLSCNLLVRLHDRLLSAIVHLEMKLHRGPRSHHCASSGPQLSSPKCYFFARFLDGVAAEAPFRSAARAAAGLLGPPGASAALAFRADAGGEGPLVPTSPAALEAGRFLLAARRSWTTIFCGAGGRWFWVGERQGHARRHVGFLPTRRQPCQRQSTVKQSMVTERRLQQSGADARLTPPKARESADSSAIPPLPFQGGGGGPKP